MVGEIKGTRGGPEAGRGWMDGWTGWGETEAGHTAGAATTEALERKMVLFHLQDFKRWDELRYPKASYCWLLQCRRIFRC